METYWDTLYRVNPFGWVSRKEVIVTVEYNKKLYTNIRLIAVQTGADLEENFRGWGGGGTF